jgi:hypothetical protein
MDPVMETRVLTTKREVRVMTKTIIPTPLIASSPMATLLLPMGMEMEVKVPTNFGGSWRLDLLKHELRPHL